MTDNDTEHRGLYAKHDAMQQGRHYADHVPAMPREQLHAKSDIAVELAHRDRAIESLQAEVARLRAENAELREHAEALGNALEALRALVVGECPSILEDDHHDTIVSCLSG